jgi:hypothetical protein
MPTDYVMFIHGVSTRESAVPPVYANGLFTKIGMRIKKNSAANAQEPARGLTSVPLYWGSVGKTIEDKLRAKYQKSPLWENFWFLPFREGMALQFAGDAALYLSRYVGGMIADKLKADMVTYMGSLDKLQPDSGDRLHIVAHSLGTIILFDLLFSVRWGKDGQGLPGWESVQAIREAIYGVEPNWETGVRLGSLTTMGSPLGLFSLIDVDLSSNDKFIGEKVANTHDVTPRLQKLLERLNTKATEQNEVAVLPWRNFAHPGDPLASPLLPLIPHLISNPGDYIEVKDCMTTAPGDWLFFLIKRSFIALLHARAAHTGYWDNAIVADTVGDFILKSAASRQTAL